jgi:hypothetical protein
MGEQFDRGHRLLASFSTVCRTLFQPFKKLSFVYGMALLFAHRGYLRVYSDVTLSDDYIPEHL